MTFLERLSHKNLESQRSRQNSKEEWEIISEPLFLLRLQNLTFLSILQELQQLLC